MLCVKGKLEISNFDKDNVNQPSLAFKFKDFKKSDASILINGIASAVSNQFISAFELTLANDDNMGINRS